MSKLKAYKPRTKLGHSAWKTQENECNLVDQSIVPNKTDVFPSPIIRRVFPSPPAGRTQVSEYDPLSQSSVTCQLHILKSVEIRQLSLRVSS